MCFAFISPITDPTLPPLDLKFKNNKIIIAALRNLGFDAESRGRNDLEVNGLKFSGSAFEVELGGSKVSKRVLHHGTILYDVDVSAMNDYLNPNVLKMKSKVN